MKAGIRIWRMVAIPVVMAAACPAHAANQTISVNAGVVKPLILTSLQNLDMGLVSLKPGAWSSVTVKLSRTGTLTCPTPSVVCSGATTVAQYRVTGSNRGTVLIAAPNVTLTNTADSSKTLTLVPDAPPSVVLTSSGFPGVVFSIGGSVAIPAATVQGDYVGTFRVTVNYQ